MKNKMNTIDFSRIPDTTRRIKIDVGLSYSAPQSEVWLDHDSDLFVFGFEPHPESVECINRGNIVGKPGHGKPISDEHLKRFALIPVALGNVSSSQTLDFYLMRGDCGTSSLFPPNTALLDSISRVVKVPVHNLSEFFDKFPWDRFPVIEYLKIDAQGSDLDILKGAGHYLSDRVVFVTAEPENIAYFGCKNSAHEIVEYLLSMGFKRVFDRNTGDPTFLNTRFEHLASSIFIYQQG